jgi:hypothetical protein
MKNTEMNESLGAHFPRAGGEKEIEKRNQCVRMRTESGADTA